MIKRGDKGTVDGKPARVIDNCINHQLCCVIAVTNSTRDEFIIQTNEKGYGLAYQFIPSKPWDSLKPGDACFARDNDNNRWNPRVFAGANNDNEPLTYDSNQIKCGWRYCIPAKLIDGELIPVEES